MTSLTPRSRSTQGAKEMSTPWARTPPRHSPAGLRGQREPGFGVGIELVPDAPCRRQDREAAAEALHPTAFVVDRDDEGWGTGGVDLGDESGELPGLDVVAGEEQHSADQRVAQQ